MASGEAILAPTRWKRSIPKWSIKPIKSSASPSGDRGWPSGMGVERPKPRMSGQPARKRRATCGIQAFQASPLSALPCSSIASGSVQGSAKHSSRWNRLASDDRRNSGIGRSRFGVSTTPAHFARSSRTRRAKASGGGGGIGALLCEARACLGLGEDGPQLPRQALDAPRPVGRPNAARGRGPQSTILGHEPVPLGTVRAHPVTDVHTGAPHGPASARHGYALAPFPPWR